MEPEFTQPEYIERERTPEYIAARNLVTTLERFINRDQDFLEKSTDVVSCSASQGNTEIIEGEAQAIGLVDIEYGFRARRHNPEPGIEYIGFEFVVESEQPIDLVVQVMNDGDEDDHDVYRLKAKTRIRQLNFQIDSLDTDLVFTEEFIYLDEYRDVISNVSNEPYDDEDMEYIVDSEEEETELGETEQNGDESAEAVTLRQLASSAMKTRNVHEVLVTEDSTLEDALAKWVVEEEARNVLPERDVLGEINLAAELFQRMIKKLQGLGQDSQL